MERLILNGQPAVDTSNNSQTVLSESHARDISQVHFPKIAIPKFNGNYENWYPFYNTFESMIHSNARLTNIQKFHYLISSLEGDATHVIQSLEINSDNYQEARDLLKQRYDDKRIITQEHIKALFELTPVAKGNHAALRKLIDDVMRYLRSLKGLDRPTDQWDDLIIYIITTKLDMNTIKDWEDNVQGENMPTLKEMIDFLAHKCKALSAISKRNLSESSVSNLRKTNKAIGVHVTTANIQCVLCKGRHHIFQCSDFLKLTVDERYKEVKAKKLCTNCLCSTTHQARDCQSSTCRTCSKRHNTLLHAKAQDKAQQEDTSLQGSNACISVSTTTLNNHVSQNKHYQVILSTAVVEACDQQGNTHKCRVLLDSGSQSNFIISKLANKLGLTLRKTDVNITGINQTQTCTYHKVDLKIKSMHNTFSQYISCYVLHKITRVPQVFINMDNFKIPSNIRLADPHFQVPADVDILLGAETFWQLLCIGQICTHKNLPTLQKTQLGWIIGGRICNLKPSYYQICNLSVNNELNESPQILGYRAHR